MGNPFKRVLGRAKKAYRRVAKPYKRTAKAAASGDYKEIGRDLQARSGVDAIQSGSMEEIARAAAANSPGYGRPGPGL